MRKVITKDNNSREAKSYHLPLTSYLSKKNGQVAVILILVVAAALIFYAISLNLGRISQTKVATTIAADTGASLMASYMASLGQSVFKTSLGGKTKVCGWTGIAASIMAIVVIIIAVIIVVISVGTGTPAAAAFTASFINMAILGVGLALAAIAIQATVIQPGLSSAYNSILWHSMETRDAFTEQGVQAGLGGAVTDSVQVADMADSDGDRVWGLDTNGQPLDKVNRFGFYYRQKRISAILSLPNSIQDFLKALDDFLNKTADPLDTWGIYDKTGPTCDPFNANSECDPCCVPLNDAAGNPIVPPIRPSTCPDAATTLARCAANSPYGAAYPWVYDPYRENPLNNVNPLDPNFFISFREQLGRDDEHRDFRKNPDDDLLTPVYDGPNGIQAPMPGDGFRLEDTTGFHAADNRMGVFKFFYKIADWGVNLQSLVTNDPLNPQCNWCNNPSNPPCPWCNAGTPGTTCDATATYPPEFPQLNLPVDPTTLTYNTTYCVDGTNPIPGNPPLAVDLVRLPDPADFFFISHPPPSPLGKIEANVDQCAQNYRDDPSVGFWKRGGDRFCSSGDSWPYYGECSKYNYGSCLNADGTVDPAGCKCGEDATVPANFPDDLMDDLVYGLNDFIKWANDFLAKDATTLSKEFRNWYPDASVWIEPGANAPTGSPAGSSAINSGTCTTCCYMCQQGDGALWVWYKDIQEIRKRLEAWRRATFASTDCYEVWCVPGAGCPGGKDTSALGGSGPEDATFDRNGNGTRGDVEDVVACLNWNVNDTATTTSSSPVTATGNYEKFRECDRACQDVRNDVNLAVRAVDAADLCSALPRSLVPGFDIKPFVNPTPLLLMCAGNCSACITACAGDAACEAACSCGGCACSDAACLATQTANAKGSCTDTGAGGFITLLQESIPEANNQVVKFRQRYNFLNGRLGEMDNLINVLQAAEDKFYQFLTCEDNNGDGQPDGAACRLIKARIDADSRETGLPYYAIYGWQSEPEKGQPAGSGKWHLVRADARIPEKCDNDCNPNQAPGSTTIDGDPRWPWVRTYTKSWGMKRCYELEGTNGLVKVRVSRFDESGTFPTLLFPNAVEIWKPTFGRGDRSLTADPGTLGAVCNPSMIADPGQPSAFPGSYYYGAFILNKRDDNPLCWDRANELLAGGVTSEACAQYYFHGGNPNGMDFKFVPCPAF